MVVDSQLDTNGTGTEENHCQASNPTQDRTIFRFCSIFNNVIKRLLPQPTYLFSNIPLSFIPKKTHPIRVFAWHKYKSKFSIALQDDSIRIYNLSTQSWSSIALRHEFQTNITCMEWKPNSGIILAVGTSYGVIIWTLTNKQNNFPLKSSVSSLSSLQGSQSLMSQITSMTPNSNIHLQPYSNHYPTRLSTTTTNPTPSSPSLIGNQNFNSMPLSAHNLPILPSTKPMSNPVLTSLSASTLPSSLTKPMTTSSSIITASSRESQDFNAWANFLHHPGYAPVNTLAWSKTGEFLATASCNSSKLLIWDVKSEIPTPLVQFCPGGITRLLWSPNDLFLFASTSSKLCRIWETCHWSSQRWTQLSSHVSSAAWSPEGTHLAFTVDQDSKIYILRFHHDQQGHHQTPYFYRPSPSSYSVDGSLVSTIDLSSYSIETRSGTRIQVGGQVGHLAWDMTGSRLVASVSEGDTESALIAVIQCSNLMIEPDFHPLGYLRGPPNAVVTSLHFRNHFSRGALLASTFSNGKITFYPLYFVPTK